MGVRARQALVALCNLHPSAPPAEACTCCGRLMAGCLTVHLPPTCQCQAVLCCHVLSSTLHAWMKPSLGVLRTGMCAGRCCCKSLGATPPLLEGGLYCCWGRPPHRHEFPAAEPVSILTACLLPADRLHAGGRRAVPVPAAHSGGGLLPQVGHRKPRYQGVLSPHLAHTLHCAICSLIPSLFMSLMHDGVTHSAAGCLGNMASNPRP